MKKYQMPVRKAPGICTRCKKQAEQLFMWQGGVYCKKCSEYIIKKRKLENKAQRKTPAIIK